MAQRWIQSSTKGSTQDGKEVIIMAKENVDKINRTLTIQYPKLLVSIDNADNVTLLENTGGWAVEVIPGPPAWAIVYRIKTWDLSGYSLQDKTVFPQGCLFQDLSNGPIGSTVANVTRATIVSTTPLNTADLTNVNSLGEWTLPGSLGSTHSLDNIISGRLQFYINTNTTSNCLQHKESQWGSGDASAADKMWTCEAYLISLTGLVSSVMIPESAIVMPIIIAKEESMEYFMRLSRSLEPVY